MAIHPTTIVDPGATIDGDAELGPFCVIGESVTIAAGCRLYQNVFVTGHTTIEEACELHPGVIVGHTPQDTHFKGDRSYCRIKRGSVLRENVTVHRGTSPESETVVGEECFLLGGAHVAHNCVLGRGVTLINNVLLAGHVTIGDRATLGGGAVVHQFVRIGELSMISGNGRVSQDVPPFAMVNADGRIIGLNRVGLRRADASREDLQHIREAYRLFFERGLRPADAAGRLAAEPMSPMVRRLVDFMTGESRRGVAGRSRRRKKQGDPQPPADL